MRQEIQNQLIETLLTQAREYNEEAELCLQRAQRCRDYVGKLQEWAAERARKKAIEQALPCTPASGEEEPQ